MRFQQNKPFSAFSTLIIFLMCCLVGVALLPKLSVQLVPSRGYSSVTVSCYLPNASQEVTELEITNPIENVLSGLKGIQYVSSNTGPGYADVHVELDRWTDQELFRIEVSSQLRQLHEELPARSSYPQVYLNRPDNNRYRSALIGYSLHGPGSTNELAQKVEGDIRSTLADVKGIDETTLSGSKEVRFFISTNALKMREAHLSHQALATALHAGIGKDNMGALNVNGERIELVVEGGLHDVKNLADFPVTLLGDRIIRLRDVATVELGEVKERRYYRVNGQNLINVAIYPEENVNTIQLAGRIKERMERLTNRLPEGYQLSLAYDNTEYIKEELGKIYFRTFLSIAILLLFVLLITRQLRYLLIVLLSILVNVLLSLIFYYFFKIEIHLYSLAGITISIGLIIDNVIVIVEDLRHTGRNRIFAAILASTFTALGALSVIFLLEESQRINLLDFALAIIINLIVSLPVAYFFIPSLLQKLPVQVNKSPLLVRRKRILVRFAQAYQRQINFMLRRKRIFIVLMILSFGLPVYMLPEKMEKEGYWAERYNQTFGSEFYSQTLRKPINTYLGGASNLYINSKNSFGNRTAADDEEKVKLTVRISMPNGATLDQMNAVAGDFERYLGRFEKELDVFTTDISGPNSTHIEILFKKPYRQDFPHRLKRMLENEATLAGSADFSVYGVGQGFSNAVTLDSYDYSIVLKGYNYQQLQGLASRVRDSLMKIPRVADVLISSDGRYSAKELSYEYLVRFTRPEYFSLYHVERASMANSIREEEERSSGLPALLHNNEYVPLEILSHADHPPRVWNAMQQPLRINDSTMLRLGDMSEIARIKQGSSIRRHNQEYLLNVHYRFIGNYTLNETIQTRLIESITKDLPYGYSVESPKWQGWWGEGQAKSLWLIGVVLLLVYMICAVLLESFKQPIAVVLMIPFSFIGVFLVFYFLELGFDQGGYAALLMLSGLVTNVALYIINDINDIKKRYKRPDQQQKITIYIKAFNAKAMPILITTASAILSLLPFMINGEESGFWFTLSAGTIGGLLFSLLGAYVMLPLALLSTFKNGKLKKNNEYGEISS